MKTLSPATRAIHLRSSGEQSPETALSDWGATQTPIYHTASFAHPTAESLAAVFEGRDFGYLYSRIANPTVLALEERLARLENGVGAIACASGMAAIAVVVSTLTGQGDQVISGKSLFGGTIALFENMFRKYGVEITYVDTRDAANVERAITPQTRLVFLETLGNPSLEIPDLGGLARLCAERNIPLAADCTLTPPFLFWGKEHGVSLVIHSTTKYITGNGTAIGGVVIDAGNFDWSGYPFSEALSRAAPAEARFRFLAAARKGVHQNLGAVLSPFNAVLAAAGLETLSLRMDRISSNAALIARTLSRHPGVREVNYPGLSSSRDHLRALHLFGGKFGGMLTLRLGSRERAFAFINRLKLVKNLANLGDSRTLVIHPASTIYQGLAPQAREAAGAPDDLVRLSVGLEDPEDLILDLTQALEGAA